MTTRTHFGLLALALAVTALAAGIAVADDRDLLRERASDPYVFIIFDTSGSMHWSPVCGAEDACEDIDPYDRACTSECEFGDVTCSQICPDFGCLEFGDTDLAPPVEIMVDDTALTGQVSIVGSWPVTTAFTGSAFGGTAISDGNSGKGSKRVTFSVVVPETRRYKVFISVPQSEQWATNVPVRVRGSADSETVRVDQRFVPPPDDATDEPPYNPWKLVGVYEFVAGATAEIRITNNGTNSPVVVDGVRLLSEVKQCLRQGYRCTVPLCPSGDCNVPLNQDDPGSKFFQAKQALYEVLEDIPFVRFGFGSFEQDDLGASHEHWLYRVRERQIDPDPTDGIDPPLQELVTLPSGSFFPQPGDDDVFGAGNPDTNGVWACNGNDLDDDAGCFSNEPGYLSDVFERGRVHRIAKLGNDGTGVTRVWITENANDSNPLRVTYSRVSGNYGDQNIVVRTRVERCTNNNCDGFRLVDEENIAYDLRSDFLGRENDAPRRGFDFRDAEDAFASGSATCGTTSDPSGWDPNNDTNQDDSGGINLRWPTVSDSRSSGANGRAFDEGDVIPWDWLPGASHTDEIQRRLAPNTVTDVSATPDFRVAKYLAAPPAGGNLRLADTVTTNGLERPLISWGSTPLGGALNSIDRWFVRYRSEAESGGSASDPVVDNDWSCREKFVLMLTDGDETCSRRNGIDPCNVATTLQSKEVSTFVIGFGLQNAPGNRLNCIAANGGTERPFFPRNKDELVTVLTAIFGEVQARARSFASASLPAVQSTAADKILFSSFTPLPSRSFWPGRVDVFRAPILDQADPPVCRNCDRLNLDSACQVFNIGDTILAQAPTDAQIDNLLPDANMGVGRLERRVFYPLSYRPVTEDGTIPQPLPMRLFELPDLEMPTIAEQAVIEDLVEVMVRPSELDGSQTVIAQLPTIKDPIKDTYRNLFRLKNSTDLADSPFTCPDRPSGAPASWTPGDYLLGDIFHTTTAVTSGPRSLALLRQDRCGAAGQVAPNNCVSFTAAEAAEAAARGYRNYARRGGWYRNMLTVGANDGQLHFFDAGVRAEVEDREVFTDGTGTELFSVVPRLVMPIVREQARPGNDRQIFSVDGGFSIEDVFIDPVFAVAPDAGQREWRRVLVGGLREGGDRFDDNRDVEGFVSSYYALDITQPDGLETINDDTADPSNLSVVDNQYIPDNLRANGVLPSCQNIDSVGNLVPNSSPACRSIAGAQVPFPAFKWEFADRVFFLGTPSPTDDANEDWYLLDEDRNGSHDLANTWSKPLVGQVRVVENGIDTIKWVAIFGGGIDPAHKDPVVRGNWLYMLDIETGTALYKRQLDGAAPADVTGSVDEKGILNALYIGTTTGFMYKVDLRESGPIVNTNIKHDQILGWPDNSKITVRRIDDERWDPFAIFTTNGKPIYQTPALIQVPVLDKVALAWGTGDREDLWVFDGSAARFYVILDDDFLRPAAGSSAVPLDETDFVTFDFNAPLVGFDTAGDPLISPPNFLTDDVRTTNDGQPAARGWIMRFPQEARVTSRAFAISGVLVFTVFQPRFDPVTGTEEPCRRSGLSRTFVVDARNGDALTTLENLRNAALADDRGLRGGDGDGAAASGINVAGGPQKGGNCGDRCSESEGLATAPFVAPNATPNPVDTAHGAPTDPGDNPITKRLLENIKRSFFPPGCQFNDTFVHRIRMQLDNTELRDIAPVPIGVCPSDWAEGAPLWSEDR